MKKFFFSKSSIVISGFILALLSSPASAIMMVYAETADTDLNFQIDRILIRFDVNVDDATVKSTDFSVNSYVVSDWTSGVSDDEDIFLILTESGISDLDAAPDVTYSGLNLEDLFGNKAFVQSIVATAPPPSPAVFQSQQAFGCSAPHLLGWLDLESEEK